MPNKHLLPYSLIGAVLIAALAIGLGQSFVGSTIVAAQDNDSTANNARTESFVERFQRRREQLIKSREAPNAPIPGSEDGWIDVKTAKKTAKPSTDAPIKSAPQPTQEAKSPIVRSEPHARFSRPPEPPKSQAPRTARRTEPRWKPPTEGKLKVLPESEPELRATPPLAAFRVKSPGESSERKETAPRKRNVIEEPVARPRTHVDVPATSGGVNIRIANRLKEALQLDTLGPREINVGEPVTFRFRVKNQALYQTENVFLELVLPHGVTVVKMHPRLPSKKLMWRVGSLAPHKAKEFEVTLIRHTPGSFELQAWLAVAEMHSTNVHVRSPHLEIDVNADLPYRKPSMLTLTIRNHGNSTFGNVQLEVQLPKNIQSDRGKIVHLNVGTIAGGEEKRAKLPVEAIEKGMGTATIILKADGAKEIHFQKQLVVRSPDLKVSAQGPQSQKVNAVSMFAAELTNEGNAPLDSVTVITSLEGDMSVIDAEEGAKIDPSQRLLGWDIQSLSPGEKQVLRWWAVGKHPGTTQQKVVVEAEAGVQQEQQMTTHVEAIPDFELELMEVLDVASIGDEIVYRARLRNSGSRIAENLVVEGELDEGMQPVKLQNQLGRKWVGNRVYFSPLKRLAPGQTAVFQLRAVATHAGEQSLRLSVIGDRDRRVLATHTETTLVRAPQRAMLR